MTTRPLLDIPPITRTCTGCGNDFPQKKFQRGKRKAWCSRECLRDSTRGPTPTHRTCDGCGITFKMTRGQRRSLKNGKTNRAFCKPKCLRANLKRFGPTMITACKECGVEYEHKRDASMRRHGLCPWHAPGFTPRPKLREGEATSGILVKATGEKCFARAATCTSCGELHVRRYSNHDVCLRCHPPRRDRGLHRKHAPAIWIRDRGMCHLCDTKIPSEIYDVSDPWSYTLDHIIPRSDEGSDDPDNLAAAHWICNGMRGDLPLEEWHRLRQMGHPSTKPSSYPAWFLIDPDTPANQWGGSIPMATQLRLSL